MMGVAHHVHDHAHGAVVDHVCLTYDARLLRRKRLVTVTGQPFVVDLAQTVSVAAGAVFILADGRQIGVLAADEPLMRAQGDLVRLAWHIGNRHAPCAILRGALVVQREKVMRAMLEHLGAVVSDFDGPFTPEGGAYGHGRTMGHSHAHDHSHDHDHG